MNEWRIRNPEKVVDLFMEKFKHQIFQGYNITIEYEMFDTLRVYNDGMLIGYITTGLEYPIWEFSNKNYDYMFSEEIPSLYDFSIIYDLLHFLEKCLLRIDIEKSVGILTPNENESVA
jgi:uncharacterized membrane protein